MIRLFDVDSNRAISPIDSHAMRRGYRVFLYSSLKGRGSLKNGDGREALEICAGEKRFLSGQMADCFHEVAFNVRFYRFISLSKKIVSYLWPCLS